ncbi:MAG: hypothetical protein B6I36_10975 [Desulfobacteraceae bacterium 4572_35.1]|nr:MAG: hypothetical protein B6I36_10975 [Desulfobacteraceae bacterium 4572_35.1]
MKNELLAASLMEVEELKTTPTEPDIHEEVKEAFIEPIRNHAQIKKFNEIHEEISKKKAHKKISKKKAQKSNAKPIKAANLKKQNLELNKKYMLFLSSLRMKNESFAMQLQQFSPHFPIIVSAMKQAQNETERNAVFALAENLTQGAQGLENDTQKHYFQTKIAMADPAIFFDFCSKPFLSADTLKDFFEQTKANVEKKLRCRDHLIEQLSLNVAIKIAGEKDSLSPLLMFLRVLLISPLICAGSLSLF